MVIRPELSVANRATLWSYSHSVKKPHSYVVLGGYTAQCAFSPLFSMCADSHRCCSFFTPLCQSVNANSLFLLRSGLLCAMAPLLHLYDSMTTRNTKKNQGLRRWAVVVAILAALVSSPDRAPGGFRAVADTQTRRETAGEVVR